MRGSESRGRSAWAWLVTGSACVVLGVAAALAVWWIGSSERRVSSYDVRGSLTGISLDLGSANAEIVGGREAPVVGVSRTDAFAFGHPPSSRRAVTDGVLRIRARCPSSVLGTCSSTYRVTVPRNVPVTVRTDSGNVQLNGFRGSASIATMTGDIDAGSFCGLLLRARAETGDVSATAACASDRLDLRSRTGDVHAVVPPGRYRIDAESDEGTRSVRGLVAADDAPFQIQALSDAGDVALEAGP